MNNYAFRVFDFVYSNPIFSGSITSSSMETAISKIMKRHRISVVTEHRQGFEYNEFIYGGKKVSIIIYANPEYYKECD